MNYDDIIKRHFHGFSDEQWNRVKNDFPYCEIPYIVDDAIKNIKKLKFNEKIGPFYVDDFPIDSSDQDLMFEIFQRLPKHEKMLAKEYGCNDTVFRDNVFEFLCKNQLGMTCKEYYKSDIAKNYFDNNVTIKIDFEKLKKNEN